ncbi:hypothetical protein LZ30DRAFT_44293 [Colletotrichum cereale]|nr:hypothetical protein LZ30DRAFT_44293 [Colletotrichum cereale]
MIEVKTFPSPGRLRNGVPFVVPSFTATTRRAGPLTLPSISERRQRLPTPSSGETAAGSAVALRGSRRWQPRVRPSATRRFLAKEEFSNGDRATRVRRN